MAKTTPKEARGLVGPGQAKNTHEQLKGAGPTFSTGQMKNVNNRQRPTEFMPSLATASGLGQMKCGPWRCWTTLHTACRVTRVARSCAFIYMGAKFRVPLLLLTASGGGLGATSPTARYALTKQLADGSVRGAPRARCFYNMLRHEHVPHARRAHCRRVFDTLMRQVMAKRMRLEMGACCQLGAGITRPSDWKPHQSSRWLGMPPENVELSKTLGSFFFRASSPFKIDRK